MPSQPTILVVDDEPAIVDALRYNLEKSHHRVLVAQDGERALQLAASEAPDLVILDLMPPGPDGPLGAMAFCRDTLLRGAATRH